MATVGRVGRVGRVEASQCCVTHRWHSIEVLARITIEHPDGWEFDWLDAPAPGSADCLLHECLYAFALQGEDTGNTTRHH